MTYWSKGDTIILRNIARSDGTVTSAIPSTCIEDCEHYLATYIAKDTPFKNNYSIPQSQRVNAVMSSKASVERSYKELAWWHHTLRIYLPNTYYSIWFFYDEQGVFTSYYGNLEAPFLRTPIGIDTRDYGLDIVANTKGEWQWKDEDEFAKRLEVNIDSLKHQANIRMAGEDFIYRLEQNEFPFNQNWQNWSVPKEQHLPTLPETWTEDFGTHQGLNKSTI